MVKISWENGSAGALLVFVVGLFILLFVFILASGWFDAEITAYNLTTNASLGSTFPVSDERIRTLNFYQTLWDAIPFLFILLPLMVYAIVVSIRRGPGDV